MTQANTTSTVDLLRSLVGRQVESKTGVLLINDVLTHKTGVLKDGSSAPYLHLVAEMGDKPEVDLHPQKALELAKKGESGAYKILAALASDGNVALETVAAMNEETVQEEPTMALVQVAPAAAEAAEALGMTVEQVVEGVEAAGAQGEAAAQADEKKESKKAGTLRIYREMIAEGKARKDIIARMRTELGLSIPGANTYYQNCKSGMWK